MGEKLLPPGFRFHPTDEELVGYYLKRKVDGLEIELEVIPVIDLYKFDPWELPDKSFLPKQDMQWFFFCPRDRKYPNGLRTNRATAAGYWKATGKERKIVCQSAVTGFRKSLVFYCGRAPLGYRTDWMMHEYRLGDDLPQGSSGFQAPFALYRVIKKNEQGLKMGEIQGEPKAKRVGGTSITGNFMATGFSSEFLSTSSENPSQATCLYNGSNYSSHVTSSNEFTRMVELDPTSNGTNLMSIGVSPDLVFDSSEDYSNSIASWKYCDYTEHSLPSSCSNIREEVDPVSDLNQIGCMSPYSAPINYAGLYRSEDETYQSFNWSGS